MPIENERKFVLLDDGTLEQQLAQHPGVTRSLLRQAYLDVSGLRIRSIEAEGAKRHVFTYKREVDGQVVEIETDISVGGFRAPVVAAPRDPAEGALLVARRPVPLGRRFLQDRRGPHLFRPGRGRDAGRGPDTAALAAATRPTPAGPGAAGDLRFTSKRLANRAHAESLLADIRKKGKIE